LEPYYLFEIELPVEHVGRAISDVRMMGGEFKAPVENDGTAVLSGASPVRTMDQYMATLASYTGGRGRLSLSPGGFRECHDAKRVTEEASYDPEADLANSPDSVFCAHGAGFVVKWCDVEKYMHVDGIREAGGEAPRRRHVSIDEEELERIMLREFGPIKRPEYSEPRRVEAKELHRVAGVGTSLLVIDGYNVIHAWDDLASLAQAGDLDGARGRLLNIIANYSSFTGCRTVVVFDAYMVPGGHGERTTYHGVEVVYTKENETADAYIERLVAGIGKNDRVRVVTSDWLIQLTAVRTGVLRLSSAEFEAEVSSVEEKISDIIEKNSEKYSDCK
ncbi:MAG: NYN domain-containing protein, partial [Clostridia bacterium]|nr:NYN domain-containing protein [Clostridia bacterium]